MEPVSTATSTPPNRHEPNQNRDARVPTTGTQQDPMLPPGVPQSPASPPNETGAQKTIASSDVKAAPIDNVQSLLPPGAVDVARESTAAPSGSSIDPVVDSLLPPGVSASPKVDRESAKPSIADSLLPPGAEADTGPRMGPIQQVALPTQVAENQPIAAGGITVPGEDGVVTLREPKRIVGTGADARELRTLTPEEKARRRFIKNVVIWSFCAIVLAVSMVCLVLVKG